MKKTLITIVLAAFCFSVPVFGSASEAVMPAAEQTLAANNTILPIFAQFRRRRRFRRARRIIVRRQYRRAYRRHRYIIRHRRR